MGDKKKSAKPKDAAKDAAKGAAKDAEKDAGGSAKEGMSKKDYLERLEPLQVELNAMARWVQHEGKRIVVVVEGRDTAGKGGVIGAIADTLSPRNVRVVALPRPASERPRSGTFSATCSTCLLRARLCCSTAVGTTAPGWSM